MKRHAIPPPGLNPFEHGGDEVEDMKYEAAIERLAIRDRLKQYLLNCAHAPPGRDSSGPAVPEAVRPDSLNPLKDEIAHAISDRIPVKQIAAMVDDKISCIRQQCLKAGDRHSVGIDLHPRPEYDAWRPETTQREEALDAELGHADMLDVSDFVERLRDIGIIPHIVDDERAVEIYSHHLAQKRVSHISSEDLQELVNIIVENKNNAMDEEYARILAKEEMNERTSPSEETSGVGHDVNDAGHEHIRARNRRILEKRSARRESSDKLRTNEAIQELSAKHAHMKRILKAMKSGDFASANELEIYLADDMSDVRALAAVSLARSVQLGLPYIDRVLKLLSISFRKDPSKKVKRAVIEALHIVDAALCSMPQEEDGAMREEADRTEKERETIGQDVYHKVAAAADHMSDDDRRRALEATREALRRRREQENATAKDRL